MQMSKQKQKKKKKTIRTHIVIRKQLKIFVSFS